MPKSKEIALIYESGISIFLLRNTASIAPPLKEFGLKKSSFSG
jgi:hypothetical protein